MSRPIIVLCPHFAPDTAPTGEVITRIVEEFVSAGHNVHVVTALPWYRSHAIEQGWSGRLIRREKTTWGSIIRVHPFPGKSKTNLARRAVGFIGFSVLSGMCTLVAGGLHRRPSAVIAMSPPLTLGLTGWLAARLRRSPMVFNIQDIFPDAAIETGAISNRRLVAVARWLERVSYRRSNAVVVLSDDLKSNVDAKIGSAHQSKVHVIPNFVDVERIVPLDRMTDYRREMGIGEGLVVMYAGNVGYSQSLEMMVEGARRLPNLTFVINGEGSARPALQLSASDVPNLVFADYQPRDRVAEVLASGDIQVVPLRAGLGRVSVPSKTYSILAAARPVVAAVDQGTEVTRILHASGGGISVPPDDVDAFVHAIDELAQNLDKRVLMGSAGRQWVQTHVSPVAVADAYLSLIASLA